MAAEALQSKDAQTGSRFRPSRQRACYTCCCQTRWRIDALRPARAGQLAIIAGTLRGWARRTHQPKIIDDGRQRVRLIRLAHLVSRRTEEGICEDCGRPAKAASVVACTRKGHFALHSAKKADSPPRTVRRDTAGQKRLDKVGFAAGAGDCNFVAVRDALFPCFVRGACQRSAHGRSAIKKDAPCMHRPECVVGDHIALCRREVERFSVAVQQRGSNIPWSAGDASCAKACMAHRSSACHQSRKCRHGGGRRAAE